MAPCGGFYTFITFSKMLCGNGRERWDLCVCVVRAPVRATAPLCGNTSTTSLPACVHSAFPSSSPQPSAQVFYTRSTLREGHSYLFSTSGRLLCRPRDSSGVASRDWAVHIDFVVATVVVSVCLLASLRQGLELARMCSFDQWPISFPQFWDYKHMSIHPASLPGFYQISCLDNKHSLNGAISLAPNNAILYLR